jgi:Tfp pilus assembly protein PilO
MNANNDSNANFEAEKDLQPRVIKQRTVKSGMFGIPEFIAVGLGILSLLAVAAFYLIWVSPANADVTRHKKDRDETETQLKAEKVKLGNFTTTKDRVEELVNSVDFFERNYLPIAENGKTALYQRINALISAYGLVNTTGPDFSPLDTITAKQSQQNDKEKGRNKFQSLFPGVYVSTTVEGSYQNLRRFMREIESSGQFVIISTVELEAAEGNSQNDESKPKQPKSVIPKSNSANPTIPRSPIDEVNNPNGIGGFSGKNLAATPKPTPIFKQPKGKTRGESVSLHLEMAAYFRRNMKTEAIAQVAQ